MHETRDLSYMPSQHFHNLYLLPSTFKKKKIRSGALMHLHLKPQTTKEQPQSLFLEMP